MTEEQLEKLHAIGKKIQEICPKIYTSIKFNLKPGRTDVNINLEIDDGKVEINESKILTETNK